MSFSVPARLEHKIYLEIKRKKLKNKYPTIISSNCNGGIILHDMELKFNTPTINLWFTAGDFLKFVSDLDSYLTGKLIETNGLAEYPVGRLNDIDIYFMHYKTFEEAEAKWEERKKRINKDNIFIMMTDQAGCTYEDIKAFDSLPYKNKVIFTHVPYDEFQSTYYIKGFESAGEVGVLSDWKPGFFMRRFLDDYDYVSFLNRGLKKG